MGILGLLYDRNIDFELVFLFGSKSNEVSFSFLVFFLENRYHFAFKGEVSFVSPGVIFL